MGGSVLDIQYSLTTSIRCRSVAWMRGLRGNEKEVVLVIGFRFDIHCLQYPAVHVEEKRCNILYWKYKRNPAKVNCMIKVCTVYYKTISWTFVGLLITFSQIRTVCTHLSSVVRRLTRQ